MVLPLLHRAGKIIFSCCFLLLFILQAKAGNIPYLLLNGADTVITEQGRTYTDAGAVAYDSANNIISNPNIVLTNPNSGFYYIPGTYTIKYNFQHNGLAAKEVRRTIIVIPDSTAPVLTITGNIMFDTVAVFETYTAPQATAQDITDGNLSASIMVNSNINTNELGVYRIKYSVADMANNKSEIEIHVLVVDTVAPVIEITDTHNDTLYIGEAFDFNKHTMSVTDNKDSSASDITITQMVGFLSGFDSTMKAIHAGTYVLGYKAVDKSGNVGYDSMYIYIIDTTAPNLVLLGNEFDTTYIYTTYKDPGVTYTDNSSDSLFAIFGGSFYSNFPNSIPTMGGMYSIVYTVTDESGNSVSISRTVVAIDTLPDISGTISLSSINYKFHRNATVYLIKFDASDSSLSAVDTSTINISTGSYFSFNDVTQGNYLVKAALDSTDSLYTDYLPTYYGGSLTWDSATTINLTANTTVNISLLTGTNTGGPGFISGKVSQGANKKEGDPLENIQILLTTIDDKPVAYTYSDKNGYFEFKNLALGTYKLFGEMQGIKALGGEITLDAENMQQNRIAVIVNSTSVVTKILADSTGTGLVDIPLASGTKIYPNPATQHIYISTTGTNTLQKIKLYNTATQLIKAQILSASKYTVLDVSHLSNGIYFLELEYNNQATERKKVIIAH